MLEIWKLLLKVKILILLLSLIPISCAKTIPIEQQFSGNFTTKHIRQYWQMCSVSHQAIGVSQVVYYPACDCAVDTMRKVFDNETLVETMTQHQSDELAVLIRLNCNNYRIKNG